MWATKELELFSKFKRGDAVVPIKGYWKGKIGIVHTLSRWNFETRFNIYFTDHPSIICGYTSDRLRSATKEESGAVRLIYAVRNT